MIRKAFSHDQAGDDQSGVGAIISKIRLPPEPERLCERLRRQNRGLETNQWRVYERNEEPRGVRLVLSTD